MLGRIERFLLENWQPLDLGPPPQRGRIRCAMLVNGRSSRCKVLCLCWRDAEPMPCLLVKFPRFARDNQHIEQEYETLGRLHSLPPPEGIQVPRPVASSELDGLRLTVETFMPGQSLRGYLDEHPERSRQELARMAPLAYWLARLHAQSAQQATSADLEALIFRPLLAAGAQLDLSPSGRAGLARLWDSATELAGSVPLRTGFNHNDCSTANILVDSRGNCAGLVDWEQAGRGLPGTDLIYFLAHFAHAARGTSDDDPLESYRDLFFARTGAGGAARNQAAARRWLADYCRRVDLAPAWLPVLFGLTWIVHVTKDNAPVDLLAEDGLLPEKVGATVGAITGSLPSRQPHFRERFVHFYLDNLDSFIARCI